MALQDVTRPEDAGLSAAGLDGVDAGLQELIDKGELAGALTLVARHGRVARRSVLGLDNVERRTTLKPDTIFRIYSMTKPVTAVAMMILHDQGLWQPDDAIAKHLPEFADVRVFDGLDDAGNPINLLRRRVLVALVSDWYEPEAGLAQPRVTLDLLLVQPISGAQPPFVKDL